MMEPPYRTHKQRPDQTVHSVRHASCTGLTGLETNSVTMGRTPPQPRRVEDRLPLVLAHPVLPEAGPVGHEFRELAYGCVAAALSSPRGHPRAPESMTGRAN